MSDTPRIVQGITSAMRHLSERQRIVAENIANSETPGYKARTVAAPDFGAMLNIGSGRAAVARPTVAITSGMAALGARPPRAGGAIPDRNVSETKPDGNNVTLEEQLLQMGQVQADFATLTNLYRKQMGLLKTAIGKEGR
jgi:flagellar basal-body rod protein FlgB